MQDSTQESINRTKDTILLFTDGSVDVKSGIGYGAWLAFTDINASYEVLRKQVKVERFVNTSSAKLELETLLRAIDQVTYQGAKIEIHTDSLNIMRLIERRGRLEQNDYISRNNRLLRNHELYREFFRITDHLDYKLIKVKGHQPNRKKDEINRIFTLVDRASRNALRNEFKIR
jgi:ribonuclease HI